MKITFIQTGGTIDKDYPKTTRGWAFEFGEPAVERVLEKLYPSFEYEIITACQKDSLEITNDDRKNLVSIINEHGNNKFIVTHGTDTMIETGLFLETSVKDKLVIITGARLPERFSNSDAPINIGGAIAAANTLKKGVYISMSGIVKSSDEIKRDMETGKFY